jgi:hypothetical protein
MLASATSEPNSRTRTLSRVRENAHKWLFLHIFSSARGDSWSALGDRLLHREKSVTVGSPSVFVGWTDGVMF